jgi:hypothetical protein
MSSYSKLSSLFGNPTGVSAKRTLCRGFQELGEHFIKYKQLRFIEGSPVLFIQSAPDHSKPDSHKEILDSTCRQTFYFFQNQMRYRTYQISPMGRFPTPTDVENSRKLAKRMGARIVAGVGSGAAIDLAKAIPHMDEMILIPATYGASIVATSTHALLYDATEQTLMPKKVSDSVKTTICTVEQEKMDETGQNDALFAAETIAVDTLYCESQKKESSFVLLERLGTIMRNRVELETVPYNQLIDALYRTGECLEYGDHKDATSSPINKPNRSMTIALMASLLTRTFDGEPAMRFMGSFFLPLRDLLVFQNKILKEYHGFHSTNAPVIRATQSIETMMEHVFDNQASWATVYPSCLDVSDAVLRKMIGSTIYDPEEEERKRKQRNGEDEFESDEDSSVFSESEYGDDSDRNLQSSDDEYTGDDDTKNR